MEDTFLICEQCGQRFVFTAKEQEAYRRKGFSTPNRCPDCRKRKMKMTAPQLSRSKERRLREQDDWC